MTGGSRHRCGHEGAAASIGYADYLQLPALLALQQPAGEPYVHDELLFIIVHQTHELWFKQMLQDLSMLVAHLDADEWRASATRIERLLRIVRLLAAHLDVLGSMPASEFQRFRGALGSASGMQSEQYREIERLLGADLPLAPRAEAQPAGSAHASASPRSSVRLAFLHALRRSPASAPDSASVVVSPVRAASQRLSSLWQEEEWMLERAVAERLIDLDSEMALWRGRHATLARQMIGATTGTGGSSGVAYLESVVERRYFPELHAARSNAKRGEAPRVGASRAVS